MNAKRGINKLRKDTNYRHSDRHEHRYIQSPFLGLDNCVFDSVIVEPDRYRQNPLNSSGTLSKARPQVIPKKYMPVTDIDRPALSTKAPKYNSGSWSITTGNVGMSLDRNTIIIDKAITKKPNEIPTIRDNNQTKSVPFTIKDFLEKEKLELNNYNNFKTYHNLNNKIVYYDPWNN